MAKSVCSFRQSLQLHKKIEVHQPITYDLLAMIRQLGTPTWFFMLSAADMKWPDMLPNSMVCLIVMKTLKPRHLSRNPTGKKNSYSSQAFSLQAQWCLTCI